MHPSNRYLYIKNYIVAYCAISKVKDAAMGTSVSDLNQNEKDMPSDPVVKGATCTYWLLDATNDTLPVPTRLSLVIEAPLKKSEMS
jgi:hypothetical protein